MNAMPNGFSPMTEQGFQEGDWVTTIKGNFGDDDTHFGTIQRIEGAKVWVDAGEKLYELELNQIVMCI